MFSTKQNFHHSKLPKLGEIGYLIIGESRYAGQMHLEGKRQRYIVESFPLCDNVLPWSIGIHTVNVRRLSDNSILKVSGFYFNAIPA